MDTDSVNKTQDPLISNRVTKAMKKWSSPRDQIIDNHDSRFEEYSRYVMKKWIFMFSCIIITVIVMGCALTVGDYNIGVMETYSLIWDHLCRIMEGIEGYGGVTKEYVVFELRLPRIIMGILAGAGLAICGAVMQSTLLNPLADPYTTGVSAGASFGATLAMTAGISISTGYYAVIGNAFIFSLIPTAVIIAMAKMKKASPTTMIMAGIAVMYVFNAFTTVMMLWADPNDLQQVYEWQVGTISSARWDDIAIVAPFVIVGIIVSMFLSRKLNILATGDESANSMGLNATHMRIICMAVVALVTAAVVSFTGLIGFVGLVAPHIVRMFIGADNRYLVPASALFGSALMIIADTVGRIVIYPGTLQVGVVMAFIGGPMFLWLILRKKNPVW